MYCLECVWSVFVYECVLCERGCEYVSMCMSVYCLCKKGCEYVCVWARVYVHEHALGFVCMCGSV